MGLINIPDRPRIFKPIGMPQIDWDDPLNRGLVGYWGMFPYEFGGKVVHDLSGNNYHGTEKQDSVWVPGKFGTTRLFSGDDAIRLPALPTSVASQARTAIVWAAADDWSDNANNAIFSFGDWGLNCFTDNREAVDAIAWRTGADDRRLMSMAGIEDGTFHQLACVLDSSGTITNLYLDGVPMALGAYIGWGLESGNLIGARKIGTEERMFKGRISHISFYNRALSASEIAELYRRPV